MERQPRQLDFTKMRSNLSWACLKNLHRIFDIGLNLKPAPERSGAWNPPRMMASPSLL
jgi:hypothetical protein